MNNSTEGGWGPQTWMVTVCGLEQENGALKGPRSQSSRESSNAKERSDQPTDRPQQVVGQGEENLPSCLPGGEGGGRVEEEGGALFR